MGLTRLLAPFFTIEPIASSVTRETFNSLIRVEFNFEIRGNQTYHSAKIIRRKYYKEKAMQTKKLNANGTKNVPWKNPFNLVPIMICL